MESCPHAYWEIVAWHTVARTLIAHSPLKTPENRTPPQAPDDFPSHRKDYLAQAERESQECSVECARPDATSRVVVWPTGSTPVILPSCSPNKPEAPGAPKMQPWPNRRPASFLSTCGVINSLETAMGSRLDHEPIASTRLGSRCFEVVHDRSTWKESLWHQS